MARVFFSWVVLLLLLPAWTSYAAENELLPTLVGEAFRVDNGELWYREQHFYSADGLQHRVVYSQSDGVKIADKSVDYSTGLLTPAFSQQSTLYDEFFAVEWQQDKLLLQYREGEAAVQQAVIAIDLEQRPLVIDAGFDHFIRQQWQPLMAGERLTFDFPAPSRQQLVELFVTRTDCDFAGEGEVCFKATLNNFILRWFVTPIKVVYSTDARLLQRYIGLANIADKTGRNHKVDIRYSRM